VAGYDFVGVAERFDDSLVVLQLLLGVPASDALYLPSKVADGRTHDFRGVLLAVHPPLADEEPAVWQYVRGAYRQHNRLDVELHANASQQLDRHIRELGQAFERRSREFRALLRVAQRECGPQVRAQAAGAPPLPPGRGTQRWAGCLYHDAGCGSDCLDRFRL